MLLFDTGYSQHFLNATATLPEALYRWVTPVNFSANRSVAAQLVNLKSNAQSIQHVILSHFHGDHIGGLHDFGNAKIQCSSVGWNDFSTRSRFGGLRIGLLPDLVPENFLLRAAFFEDCTTVALPQELAPFVNGYDLFNDGSVIAVELAGHAVGHFGITFTDASMRRVFLIGDAAWSSSAIEQNIPPPAVVSGWLGDTAAYRTTLSMLHDLNRRSPHIHIVPSHCHVWRRQAMPL
jgi:glyoxylase-like metal-dependent hydrolase (beta-lactamase superfamily II)